MAKVANRLRPKNEALLTPIQNAANRVDRHPVSAGTACLPSFNLNPYIHSKLTSNR